MNQADGMHAEQGHIPAAFQGQGVVFVLQHDKAFGTDFNCQFFCRLLFIFQIQVVGVVHAVGTCESVGVASRSDCLSRSNSKD